MWPSRKRPSFDLRNGPCDRRTDNRPAARLGRPGPDSCPSAPERRTWRPWPERGTGRRGCSAHNARSVDKKKQTNEQRERNHLAGDARTLVRRGLALVGHDGTLGDLGPDRTRVHFGQRRTLSGVSTGLLWIETSVAMRIG